MNSALTCVDAFSGAGGLSLGLQKAGVNVLLSFDIDTKCIETQRANPKYISHDACESGIDDMLNGALLQRIGLSRGELFLLAGGPPCQGFSVQRIGEDTDDRNNLVLKYINLVKEVQPHFFLMENVPGIEGQRGRSVLDKALLEAHAAGYWIHRKAVDAQDFGVPQRRRRILVVGERMDGGFGRFKFPEPSVPAGKHVTVREAIGHLPAPPPDGSDHPQIRHHRRDRLSEINLRRLAVLTEGQGRQFLPKELLARCHRIDSAIMGHRNVYGRMSWDDVAPTITARFDSFTRGLFGHPEQMRSITLREGALLQTFPHDFDFVGSKVEVARQIGNAVPLLLAEAIGHALIQAFTQDEEKIELLAEPEPLLLSTECV